MSPTPTSIYTSSKEVSICDLAFAVPTLFDILTFFLFSVLPVLIIFVLLLIIFTRKQKKAFLKQLFMSPFLYSLILLYFFTYPKNYIEYRHDNEVVKRCDCIGIKSELLGGNGICSNVEQCWGVPHSCKTAEDKCHYEKEGEITINKMESNDPEEFTETKALGLVAGSNIPVEVIKITETQMARSMPYLKTVSITYKTSQENKNAFMDYVIYLPLQRGAVTLDEEYLCERTNL